MLTEFGYETYVFRSRSTNGMPLYYQRKYFIILEDLASSQRSSARRLKNSKKIENKENSRLRKLAHN
jgi:hypothetical protein